MTKTIPATRTAVKATCQLIFRPRIMSNVKNAFKPIPGAGANGQLAHSPIIRVQIVVETQVTTITVPNHPCGE